MTTADKINELVNELNSEQKQAILNLLYTMVKKETVTFMGREIEVVEADEIDLAILNDIEDDEEYISAEELYKELGL